MISPTDQQYLDYQYYSPHFSSSSDPLSSPLKTMAPQVFYFDKIRSASFEDEDYRLELFVYWTKAKSKRLAMKDDNLRLNAPFCVRVFQRPKSNRLFAPTGWCEFTEVEWELPRAPWVSDGYVPGECVACSRLTIFKDRHTISAGLIARPFGLQFMNEVWNH